MKYLGVAEIYIRRIAQNVPILMIFSQIFRGACPRTHPLRLAYLQGLIHHRSPTSKNDAKECYRPDQLYVNLQARGVDKSGRSRVNELLNE